MANQVVQAMKGVAGDPGVHVVFRVVVHVPVKEADKRMERESSATEPVIRGVMLQADVLGVVA